MSTTRQRTDQEDFWKFTDEEMDTAKNTDLPDLLEHLGYLVGAKSALRETPFGHSPLRSLAPPLPTKPEGRLCGGPFFRVGSYYTTREMDSLMIKDRRTWKRYSNGKGGDTITFLQEFEGKGFREAVNYLLEFNGRARSPDEERRSRAPPEEEKRPEFALPPANGDNRRVFACVVAKSAQLRFRLRRKLRSLPCSSFSHRTRFAGLRWEPYGKRGIAPQVIRAFLNTGLLYEDERYHNCVFVGRDGNGQPKFACKRGTYDKDGASFKRDVLGSDKSVAFPIPCDPAIPWVLVFEAPIDLMSFCTLNRMVCSNAVALCGLYPAALDRYLRDHPHLNHVVLCLDKDGPGQEAAEKLRAEYEGRGLKVSTRTPAKGKDWNEYLQQRGPPRERGR